MARIRTLKPETATDRKLASVSREARYTFLLMISQADDDGLLRAEPRQLLGNLYPYDSDVTTAVLDVWLAELVGIGALKWRATVDGVRVAQIANWSKHQIIKNRSKPFILTQLAKEGSPLTASSVGPTEAIPQPSVDPGGAESRVLSLEPRALLAAGRRNKTAEASPGTLGKPGGWPAEWGAVYSKAIGEVDEGRIGKRCGVLIKKFGEERAFKMWKHYIHFRPMKKFGEYVQGHHDTRGMGPEDFVATAAEWFEMDEVFDPVRHG